MLLWNLYMSFKLDGAFPDVQVPNSIDINALP